MTDSTKINPKIASLNSDVILQPLPTDFSYIPKEASSVKLDPLMPNGRKLKMKFTKSYRSFQNVSQILPGETLPKPQNRPNRAHL
jgi:hypothetical protein